MPSQVLTHYISRKRGKKPTVPVETSGEEVSVVIWDGADKGKIIDARGKDWRVVSDLS